MSASLLVLQTLRRMPSFQWRVSSRCYGLSTLPWDLVLQHWRLTSILTATMLCRCPMKDSLLFQATLHPAVLSPSPRTLVLLMHVSKIISLIRLVGPSNLLAWQAGQIVDHWTTSLSNRFFFRIL